MSNKYFAFFGGYGDQYWWNLLEPNIKGNCNGITVCTLDSANGVLKPSNSIDGIESPATLCVSPDQKFLYAANELNNFRGTGYGGGISAFSIDKNTGNIRLINQSLAFGSCTAYITIDKTGKYLLVANHGSYYYCSRYKKTDKGLEPDVIRDEGCVCLFEVREDGGVGELLDRLVLEGTGADPFIHASSHPHSVLIDNNDFIIIPNKGGDNIYVCKLDREKEKIVTLSVFHTGFGSSPRHAMFCPGTPYVLVLNEFDAHLSSYRLDYETGKLTQISRLDTYNPNFFIENGDGAKTNKRQWACDVQLHPNGKFVYCNNHQNIIILFYFDKTTGSLELAGHYPIAAKGMTRGMQIDRNGKFLVVTCVLSNKAICYSLDQETGVPEQISEVELPTPTALRFVYPD